MSEKKRHVQDLDGTYGTYIVPLWEVVRVLNTLTLKGLIVFALNGRPRYITPDIPIKHFQCLKK